MKYWKCVSDLNSYFKVGNIYETDDKGSGMEDKDGYIWSSSPFELKKKGVASFKESTRREYLLQLECEFSSKLKEICKKHNITNIWNFNSDDRRELYFVCNGVVCLEIPDKELATINAWEILKEDKKENKEEEVKMKEFKVGDRVRIINELNGHEFKIGEVVVIIEDDESKLPYKCMREDGEYVDSPWVDGEEIELADSTKDFELNISSKDGITSCTYKLNGELKKNESVKLYYKDTFDIETAVDEVLKKVFAKKPHEVFEINLQKELGHKPTSEELIEAYRKEME